MTKAKPVTDTVFFTVTVRSRDLGDHWFAETVETGLIAYGETQEEAEKKNGEANEKLVRWIKAQGRAALDRFMKERGLRYALDRKWREPPSSFEQQPLAA